VDPGTGCSQASYALDDVLKCALDFAGKIQSLSDELGSGVERSVERVDLVKACLKDWIDGVEERVESLEAGIREVRSRIDNIFDVDCLKKVKYSLHSVCIHEGNAVSGHFWTYIWNPEQLKW